MTLDPNHVLDIQNLTFAYDVRNVVDGVSFSVNKHEVIGILGPNGAGKTTTIRLITGVLPLKKGHGSVRVLDKDFSSYGRQCKSSFGIVPETSNAFLDFTVWENLMFSGQIYGLSRADITRKADELLETFNLREKKHAKTKSLSKGLKQRLNFCLALLHDPPVLIFDEPTSGLDPMSTNLVRQRIKAFKNQGKTVLLTTHDLVDAEKLCDRVLIMNKGKIIAFKSPSELKREFKTPTQVIFKITGNPSHEIEQEMVARGAIESMGGGTFRLATSNPFKDIADLHQFVATRGIETELVKVTDTSLEEVFMKMIENANKND